MGKANAICQSCTATLQWHSVMNICEDVCVWEMLRVILVEMPKFTVNIQHTIFIDRHTQAYSMRTKFKDDSPL